MKLIPALHASRACSGNITLKWNGTKILYCLGAYLPLQKESSPDALDEIEIWVTYRIMLDWWIGKHTPDERISIDIFYCGRHEEIYAATIFETQFMLAFGLPFGLAVGNCNGWQPSGGQFDFPF